MRMKTSSNALMKKIRAFMEMDGVSTPFWLTIPNNDISNDPSHDLSRIQKTARQSKKSLFILKLAKLSKWPMDMTEGL
ncbi:hypothetical protein CDL15_Pgr000859 [Punica granatum]|uniref:Uncharacterized protein n=1 Tax=Punica granatum TaxID=22663 RepID=A0A218Y0J9_PUNGR|nr:hypothetical protein CDL15_Pgr000859 [Punica granatum]